MKYIIENDLMRETIISKGKGKLTPKLFKMLNLIAINTFRKLNIVSLPHLNPDVYSEGLLELLENWKKVNHLKYDKLLPYYTEIFKRGAAQGFNRFYYHQKNYHSVKVKSIYLFDIK